MPLNHPPKRPTCQAPGPDSIISLRTTISYESRCWITSLLGKRLVRFSMYTASRLHPCPRLYLQSSWMSPHMVCVWFERRGLGGRERAVTVLSGFKKPNGTKVELQWVKELSGVLRTPDQQRDVINGSVGPQTTYKEVIIISPERPVQRV